MKHHKSHAHTPNAVLKIIKFEKKQHESLPHFMPPETIVNCNLTHQSNHIELSKCIEHCVKWTQRGCDSSRILARLLASIYNGSQFKTDLSQMINLDSECFEHLINLLKIIHSTRIEPRSFIADDRRAFEEIISQCCMENYHEN